MMWRHIEGFETYLVNPYGVVWSRRAGKPLKPHMSGAYHRVLLQEKGKKWRPSIHRLVALSYLSNPHNKENVNHIDGNKLNNKVTNLEWVTRKENVRHAWDTGLVNTKGEGNGRSKLKSRHVEAIRLIKDILPASEIAELFGVGKTAISDIINNRTWKV